MQCCFDHELIVFRVTLVTAEELFPFLIFFVSADPFDTFATLSIPLTAFFLSDVATSNRTLIDTGAIVYTI